MHMLIKASVQGTIDIYHRIVLFLELKYILPCDPAPWSRFLTPKYSMYHRVNSINRDG